MLPGVEGAVLVETVPSSDTKRVEGKIKAGRMPFELEQLLLFQSPLELTYSAPPPSDLLGPLQPVASQHHRSALGMMSAYSRASSSVSGAAFTDNFP